MNLFKIITIALLFLINNTISPMTNINRHYNKEFPALGTTISREEAKSILHENTHQSEETFNVQEQPISNEYIEILHDAAYSGNINTVMYLINKGVNIDSEGHWNQSPLHSAYEGENYEIIEFLIDSGASINSLDSRKQTALHSAAFYGDYEYAEYLIKHGADVFAVNQDDQTPLHFAIMSFNKENNVDLIKLLLKKEPSLLLFQSTNKFRNPLNLIIRFSPYSVEKRNTLFDKRHFFDLLEAAFNALKQLNNNQILEVIENQIDQEDLSALEWIDSLSEGDYEISELIEKLIWNLKSYYDIADCYEPEYYKESIKERNLLLDNLISLFYKIREEIDNSNEENSYYS